MLFDIRQPVPLMIVAALHIAVLMLFQSGLHRPQVSPPEIRPVAGYLVRPQIEPVPQASKALPELPPTPLPRIAEPAPPEIAEVPPKTAEAPPKIAEAPPPKIAEAPKPKVKKPAPKPPRRKPSDDPVTQPVRAEPAVPAIAATPEAAAPPPAAPPASEVAAAPPTPAAPAAPAPVAAPRFDAAYLNNPAPAYPPLSRRMGEEGKVVLRVQVSPGGKATDVQLHSSSGSSRLDDAAREAVRGWRFVPAMRAEQAIAAWVLVPVSFRLDG